MSDRLLQDGSSLRLLQDGSSLRLLQDGETGAPATAITLLGPASGNYGAASTDFTAQPNGTYTGTIAIAPTSSAGTGVFTPTSANSVDGAAVTFTYAASSVGARNINVTNNAGLTAPPDVAYTANAVAPGAPTSVIVTDNHDGTLSVAFVAPADNGGAAITGYTATWASGSSNPGASSPIVISLTGLENGVAGTATVTATNSAGTSAAGTSGSVTPSNTNTVDFTVHGLTFPTGVTPGAGLAYRIYDPALQVWITDWITTGLVRTTNMVPSSTQPAGYSINATIPWQTSGNFSGAVQLRSASSNPTYAYGAINVYGTSRGATLRYCSVHVFPSGDTITFPGVGVRVFKNVAGVLSDDIAHTSTGVRRLLIGSNSAYVYDVVLAPNARGGLDKVIVWDTGGGSPMYDHETISVPARTAIAGDQPFLRAFTWPSGTTLGTIGYQIRYLSAGSWVSTGWLTAGAVATTAMDGAGSQSAGASVNASFTANEADGSTTALIVARSHSSSPVYAFQELNLQATLPAGATVAALKVILALATDVFTDPGVELLKNVSGVLSTVGSHITGASLVAIPEFVNLYAARLNWDPAVTPFAEWDEDATLYLQDELSFPAYARIANSSGRGRSYLTRANRRRTEWIGVA